MAIRCGYSVSFEFDLRPVLTAKGVVEAGSAKMAAKKALQEAKEELRPVSWRSVVVVLERLEQGVQMELAGDLGVVPVCQRCHQPKAHAFHAPKGLFGRQLETHPFEADEAESPINIY